MDWLGILTAVFMPVAALVVVLLILRRVPNDKGEYDERQQLARGRAAKAGMWATFAYFTLYAILDYGGIHWCPTWMGCALGIVVGGTVFALSTIIQGAYLRPNEGIGHVIFCCVLILNTWIMDVAGGFILGRFVENGLLTKDAFSVLLRFHMLLIFAALLIRFLLQRRQEKKEEREEAEAQK